MAPTKKLKTVNIKELTREELEQAYKIFLKISFQKTELINNMKYGKFEDVYRAGHDIKKLANLAVKELPS